MSAPEDSEKTYDSETVELHRTQHGGWPSGRTLRSAERAVGLHRIGDMSPSVRSGIYLGTPPPPSEVQSDDAPPPLVEHRWAMLAQSPLGGFRNFVTAQLEAGAAWPYTSDEEKRWVLAAVKMLFHESDFKHLRARADKHATDGPEFSIAECAPPSLAPPRHAPSPRPPSHPSPRRPAGPLCSARPARPAPHATRSTPAPRDATTKRFTFEWLMDFILDCLVTQLIRQDADEQFSDSDDGDEDEDEDMADEDEDERPDSAPSELSQPDRDRLTSVARMACASLPVALPLGEEETSAGEEARCPYTTEQLIDVCAHVIQAFPATANSSVGWLFAALRDHLDGLEEEHVLAAVTKVRRRGLHRWASTPASHAGAAAAAAFAAEDAAKAAEEEGAKAAPSSPRPEKRGAGERLSPGSARQTRKQPVPPSRDGWGPAPPPREGFRTLNAVQKKARKSREEERRRAHEAGGAASSSGRSHAAGDEGEGE